MGRRAIDLSSEHLKQLVASLASCTVKYERTSVRAREMAKEILRLRESVGQLIAVRDTLLEDRTLALKRAYELTLDCQTLDEAVADLVRQVREARDQRDEAEGKYRWMVERAADQKLDGYRELAIRAAAAENELDKVKAEISKLKRGKS